MSDIFAVRMLGHNLTTEVRGGSYAASQTGNDVRQDYLRDDAQVVTTTLRNHVAEPIRVYNFGGTSAQTPWPEYDIEPAADLKAKAEGIEAFGKAIKALDDAGQALDNLDAIAAEFDLELSEVEKPDPPPMPPMLPPQPPQDDASPDESDEELSSVRLASGDDPRDNPGFVRGQAYVDSAGDHAVPMAKRAFAPDLKAVLDIVQSSTSYSDMRARLREVFAEMDPDRFARLIEKALVLGDLAGQEAVLQDL